MIISLLKSSFRGLAVSAVLFAVTLTASISISTDASSQTLPMNLQCGNRDQMVKTLGNRFKEDPFAMGLASNVNLFEVFISKKGTWTILSTRADGRTCIIAAGKSWVSMPVKLKGDAVKF